MSMWKEGQDCLYEDCSPKKVWRWMRGDRVKWEDDVTNIELLCIILFDAGYQSCLYFVLQHAPIHPRLMTN